MTDLLIAGEFEKAEIQNALRSASGINDIVVLTRFEDCLELSQLTNWVTYHPNYNQRFPTFISAGGMVFPKTALSELAKILNCEIAFELHPDPNPNVYSLVNTTGKVSTLELCDRDIDPIEV